MVTSDLVQLIQIIAEWVDYVLGTVTTTLNLQVSATGPKKQPLANQFMSQQNRKKSQEWDSHNFISNGIFKSM